MGSVKNQVPEVRRLARQTVNKKKVALLETNLVVAQRKEAKEVAKRQEMAETLAAPKKELAAGQHL